MLYLPAATSEDIDIPVAATDIDPMSLRWEAALSPTSVSTVDPAPDTFTPATVHWNGPLARPQYSIRVSAGGRAAGVYGVWVRVADGDTFAAPVRFSGRVRFY